MVVGMHTDKKIVAETLYAAMVDEMMRLKTCKSKSERNNIRNFILKCFEALETNFQKNECQDIFPKGGDKI